MQGVHPHIHALVTCGAFTEAGEFVPLPAFDAQALLHTWEEAVYALYLREQKIEPAVVEQIRGWRHWASAWISRSIWQYRQAECSDPTVGSFKRPQHCSMNAHALPHLDRPLG